MSSLDISFLGGPRPQRGVGVVAPFDFALDRELWRWVPDEVSLHLTRTPFVPVEVSLNLARLVSDKVSSLLGQSVVVVNKTGGGGAVGIKAVKDAPPDGYTILIAPPPIVLIPLARKAIGFTLNDFAPVNLIGNTPAVMIIKADGPWQNLEQFIAEAKKKPGQLTFGTPGTGTSGHFAMELFKKETGVDFIELFNRGTSAVSLDGWSVQYASATGSSWQVTTLEGSIDPGRYYLIQQAQQILFVVCLFLRAFSHFHDRFIRHRVPPCSLQFCSSID